MGRINSQQLGRRLEKLEAMWEQPEAHVIYVSFGDEAGIDQTQSNVIGYHRTHGEDDAAFRNMVVSERGSTQRSTIVLIHRAH